MGENSDIETRIRQNVQEAHEGCAASRYKEKGVSTDKEKLSSKNFDRLMKQRGLSPKDRVALKKTMLQDTQMQVRHAKAGEKFITTHGRESSSGIFVSKDSLGNNPNTRIDCGALPHSNTAEYETKVELAKDQNLVYGTIAPQKKFSMMDVKQQPRSGGGEQAITDGGYHAGAVIDKDSKYPIPASELFQKQAGKFSKQHNLNLTENKGQVTQPKGHTKLNEQSR